MGRTPDINIPLGPQDPSLNRISKHHPVTIEKVENGFIVRIGCKTFVETLWSEVCKALALYWDDPKAAQRHYCP